MKIDDLDLLYGANEHQAAEIEANDKTIDYETDTNLTYGQFIKIANGLNLVSEFYDVAAACSVSESGICAVALGSTIDDAVEKIMDSDPINFISATILLSQEPDINCVKYLKETNFIVAPSFSKSVKDLMMQKQIHFLEIKTPLKDYKKYLSEDIINTPLGTIKQAPNLSELNKDTFKVVSKEKPTVEQIEDAVFAWKVVKHIKSQGIVIAKDLKTSSVAAAINPASIEYVLDNSCEMTKDAILASDMPISAREVEILSQGRIGLIIVPSANSDVVKTADKYSISLITTGITNILY